MTSPRSSRIITAFIGFVLSALIAVEPVLAGASQSAMWEQRHAALLAHIETPAIIAPKPRPESSIEAVLHSSPGRLASSTIAKSSSARTLVLIQDIHMNAEAQANIRQTVDRLLASGSISFVALEGASGDIDLSIRTRNVSDVLLAYAADYLLRTGRISGAVYALLTNRTHRVSATGVEAPLLYEANVRAAARGRSLLPESERRLAEIRERIERLERVSFNPQLEAFVNETRAARSGSTLTPAFAALLLQQTPGATASAPQLRLYLEAASLERAFDSARLEAERRRLMERLLPSLSDAERSALLQCAMDYRTGRRSQAELFHTIESLGRTRGIALAEFPALRAHVRYLEITESIDVEKLGAEARDIEAQTLDALTRSQEERVLRDADRWLESAAKLVRFGMSRDEWMVYSKHKESVPAIIGNAAPDLRPFESFYALATSRDKVIARSVEKLFAESGAGAGILVAGGFHAEGLSREFGATAPRILKFTPRLTRDPDNQDSYFSVFTREKTPLDRLLDGERLFLANPPARLGLLPEMLLLEEEAADPSHPLSNPTRRLGELRGHPVRNPVTSRDVWPAKAEVSSDVGRLLGSFDADGAMQDLTLMDVGPESDPYPNVSREIILYPPDDGSAAPTIDDVYGPLFSKVQAWAEINMPHRPAVFLSREINMRTRTIHLRKIEKDERLPVSVYAEEAARLRRFFPGYQILAENVQGIGAAKGILRQYKVVGAERFSLLPGYPLNEKPFVSFEASVADAENEARGRARRAIDYTMGPYFYKVRAVVPPARPEDFEFLETFRPLNFLRAHRGNAIQQSFRAAGILGIWLAMLAAPLAVAYVLPVDALRLAVVLVGYVQLGGAYRMARANPNRRLSTGEKLLVHLAYLPNASVHAAYNFLFPFAPLTMDPKEAEFRAWAATVKGQSVATTKAELQTLYGFTDYRVRQLLKEFAITAGAKQKSQGRKDLEEWAKPRAGTAITETTEELAIRHKISESLVLIVLEENNIQPVGKQLSQGRKNVEAWAATKNGKTVTATRLELVERFETNLTTLVAVLKRFNVKLLNPDWAAARKRWKTFDTWAKKRAGQTVNESTTALAERRGIPYREAKASIDRHGVITAKPDKSPSRLRLEAWAAEHRGQTVPESRVQLEDDYDLSYPTIDEVLTEFSITTTRGKPRRSAKPVDRSLGAFLQPFEGKSINRTPEQLAKRFGIDLYLVHAVLSALKIRTPADDASMMLPETRAAFEAEGRGNPNGARARLLFAPDREYLRAFHPVKFLSSHNGTRIQQTARAIGIAAIWLAMIGTPIAVAHFVPDDLKVITAVVGAIQLFLSIAIARLDDRLQLPTEIKAGLFLIYLPNVFIHALYNLIVWFAPLSVVETSRDDFIREAFEEQLIRLRTAFQGQPDAEERAQRTLAHLWLSPLGADMPDLIRWHGSLSHAVRQVIEEDIPLSNVATIHEIRLVAREELTDEFFRSTYRRTREPGQTMVSADKAVYYVNEVKEGGYAINMANASSEIYEGIRLIYEVQDGVMIIVELQKQGGTVSMSPVVTERLLENTIEAARAAGVTAVRLPVAGEIIDEFVAIPPFAAQNNYARLPWKLGFRLEMSEPMLTRWGAGNPTGPLFWELPLKNPDAASPETPEKRIERELAGVQGIFYYPAGGSDWKPFRHFLPRMPHVRLAVYADREYGTYFPHANFYKEERARRLMTEQGLTITELPGPKAPDHINVSDETGRSWRVEFHPGDIIANTAADIVSQRRSEQGGGVGYIHIERPGEGAGLAIGKNSGRFHARLITQLRTGGLLGGYQRPAEEPLEFLQDRYDLIGIERLGKDAGGNLFLKKIRQVDTDFIIHMIELDRDLVALYHHVEYPFGFGWTPADHRRLGEILAELRKAGLDDLAQNIRARFDDKFQMQIKTHGFHPDTFSAPMARMALFVLLLTIGIQSGTLFAEPVFRLVLFGTGFVELAIMAGTVFFGHLSGAKKADLADAAELESRARVLVRAARALSQPGRPVSNELIEAALYESAQSVAISSRNSRVRSDWPASFANPQFTTILDRVIREESAGELDPTAVRTLVETLSGWGLPVDANALIRPNVVVKVGSADDVARVPDIQRRLPGSSVLIWADEATAAALAKENLPWPIAIYTANVFSGDVMRMEYVAGSLPKHLREAPENLVFVLPNGISIDDSGLPADSAWRSVRLLVIDQVLGLLKVITVQQRLILDRVADHLVAARQA